MRSDPQCGGCEVNLRWYSVFMKKTLTQLPVPRLSVIPGSATAPSYQHLISEAMQGNVDEVPDAEFAAQLDAISQAKNRLGLKLI